MHILYFILFCISQTEKIAIFHGWYSGVEYILDYPSLACLKMETLRTDLDSRIAPAASQSNDGAMLILVNMASSWSMVICVLVKMNALLSESYIHM